MSDNVIKDMAIAASFACDGYFITSTIEQDIDYELPVGDTLDREQIPLFLQALNGEVEVDHRYDAIERDYDTTGIGAKFDRRGSLHDVYWDEILEILLNDNGE